MWSASALALLLSASPPLDPSVARAELDRCAARIEALKARGEFGRELDRLLRRAHALAAELERAEGDLPASPAAPSPEELRERADSARDEADRLAAELAALDVRIQDARRVRAEPGAPFAGASLSGAGGGAGGADRVRSLLAERAVLAAARARAEAEAARLEAEAGAVEREELAPRRGAR